jgi:hypothetical protein
MTLAQFAAEATRLENLLRDAMHSVSLTGHQMEMLPNSKTIAAYESALDVADDIRRQMGQRYDAEMALRAKMAGRSA